MNALTVPANKLISENTKLVFNAKLFLCWFLLFSMDSLIFIINKYTKAKIALTMPNFTDNNVMVSINKKTKKISINRIKP